MKRLFSDSMVYGISGIISKMINVFLLPLYSSEFSVSEYGIISIFVVVITILSQLSILQLDSGVFRFVQNDTLLEDKKKSYSTWFFMELSISLFFFILVILFSNSFSSLLFSTSEWGDLLIVGVIAIPINTFEYVCMTEWRINSKKWDVTILNILGVLLQIGLTYYLLVYENLGVYSIAWATLIVAILKSSISFIFIKDLIKIKAFNFLHLKELLHYSMPFIPAGLSLWVVSFIDRFMLEKAHGTFEVGIYQMGNTVSSLILIPISGFLFAWSPYVFSILKQENHKEQIAKLILWFTIGISIISFIACVFASEAIYFFSNSKFYSSLEIIVILIYSNVLMGLYQLSGIGSSIMKKTKPIMWATIFAAIINVVLNLILIPLYDVWGASVATFISYAVIPLFLFYVSHKIYPIPFNFKLITFSFSFLFLSSYFLQDFFNNLDFSIYFFVIKLVVFIVLISLVLLIGWKKKIIKF